MRRHEEVVVFTCGQMADPRPLIKHAYEMWTERWLNMMRLDLVDQEAEGRLEAEGKDTESLQLFNSLQVESGVSQDGNPYHNKYLNRYNHMADGFQRRPRDTTPVYCPSRLYLFDYIGSVLTVHTDDKKETVKTQKAPETEEIQKEEILLSLVPLFEIQKAPETEEIQKVPETEEMQKAPETEEIQKGPETEEIQKAPEMEEIQKAPETEEIQKGPETEEIQKTPETEEMQKAPEMEEIQKAPETEEIQKVPETEEMQKAPETEEIQKGPETEEIQKAPEMEEIQKAPETEEIQKTPETEEIQKAPETEEMQKAPETEEIQKGPETEEIQKAPETEEIQKAPEMEEIQKGPETEEIQKAPETEEIQKAPETEEIQKAPETEEIEKAPETEEIQKAPETEEIQKAPEIVEIQSAPETEESQREPVTIKTQKIPDCAIRVYRPYPGFQHNVLTVCEQICRKQNLIDLCLSGLYLKDETVFKMSRNTQSVVLVDCGFDVDFLRDLLRQLSDCTKLQKLFLGCYSLRRVEKELDEVLENLVAHHEREIAEHDKKGQQMRLKIICGDDVSQDFKNKWELRCRKLKAHFSVVDVFTLAKGVDKLSMVGCPGAYYNIRLFYVNK